MHGDRYNPLRGASSSGRSELSSPLSSHDDDDDFSETIPDLPDSDDEDCEEIDPGNYNDERIDRDSQPRHNTSTESSSSSST